MHVILKFQSFRCLYEIRFTGFGKFLVNENEMREEELCCQRCPTCRMNVSDKSNQTTITVFPHYFDAEDAENVHVCCNVASQTVAHFNASATPSEIINGLSYTPIQEIYRDAADVVDIPKRFVLTFSEEETLSTTQHSEESLMQQSMAESPRRSTSSDVTPPKSTLKPSLKAQNEMEKPVQTDLSVKPFFLGMDTVAQVFCDVEVQTSAMFTPEEDNEVVASYFRMYHEHDATPRENDNEEPVWKKPPLTPDDIAIMCRKCCTIGEVQNSYHKVRKTGTKEEERMKKKKLSGKGQRSIEDVMQMIREQLDHLMDTIGDTDEEDVIRIDEPDVDGPKVEFRETAFQTEEPHGDPSSCLGVSFRHKSCDCGCHDLEEYYVRSKTTTSNFSVTSCSKCLCLSTNARRRCTSTTRALCFDEGPTQFSQDLDLLYEADGEYTETYMELVELDLTATPTAPEDKLVIEVYKSPKICTCIREVELPWDDIEIVRPPPPIRKLTDEVAKSEETNNAETEEEFTNDLDEGSSESDAEPIRSDFPKIPPQPPQRPVYDPERVKYNEPYMERLFALFDSESRIGACTSRVEIPWQDIELPKRVTLRKRLRPRSAHLEESGRRSSVRIGFSHRLMGEDRGDQRSLSCASSRTEDQCRGDRNRNERIAALLDSCKREMEPIRAGINQLKARIKELNLPDIVYSGIPYATSSMMTSDMYHSVPIYFGPSGTSTLYQYPFSSWMFPNVPVMSDIRQSCAMNEMPKMPSHKQCTLRTSKRHRASTSSCNTTSETVANIESIAPLMGDGIRSSPGSTKSQKKKCKVCNCIKSRIPVRTRSEGGPVPACSCQFSDSGRSAGEHKSVVMVVSESTQFGQGQSTTSTKTC